MVLVLCTLTRNKEGKKGRKKKSKTTLRIAYLFAYVLENSIKFNETFSQTGYVLWVCCTKALLSLKNPPS